MNCPDVDNGSSLVDQIELRANANATEYPTERPLDCGWPDLRRHFLHVDADECLAGLADGRRVLSGIRAADASALGNVSRRRDDRGHGAGTWTNGGNAERAGFPASGRRRI